MGPRRLATLAVLGGTIGLAGWTVAGLVGFESPAIQHTDTALVVGTAESDATALTVRAKDVAPVLAKANPVPDQTANRNPDQSDPADTPAPVSFPDEAAVAVTTPDSPPMSNSSPAQEAEARPVQVATANASDSVETEAPPPSDAARPTDAPDECLVDMCIDEYLWSLYERTPKQDCIKESEQKKVTVKKNGKTRTVTKTITKIVDEDFTWKDPKAAEKAGMSMKDYVIGGMDHGFRLRLYHTLRALDAAGLMPGITSAFRDDYRQSLAKGLKAANDRSYHGGSFRGGYGHGLAADLVSVRGATRLERMASSDELWRWIDAHGKDYGLGRPYLDHDPPHVAPIDGTEYVNHHHASTQHAKANAKKHHRLAEHGAAKHARAARPSKVSYLTPQGAAR
jgi:hypothetical protein